MPISDFNVDFPASIRFGFSGFTVIIGISSESEFSGDGAEAARAVLYSADSAPFIP